MLLLPARHHVSLVAIIAARLSTSPAAARFAVTAFTPHISHTHCSSSRSHTLTGSMSQLSSSATPASSAPITSTRYILSYDYIPDVLEKRDPYREGHLGLAKSMVADGTCINGGPTFPPGKSVPNGALFVFTTKGAAETFVAGDPYVTNGIVTGHKISEWSVLLGSN